MSPSGYIRLVHWKQEELPERISRLGETGYEIRAEVPGTSIGIRALTADPPIAFVIDLSRLPSHGLEVARSVRQSKALRPIPILFVGGAEEKLDRVRAELPDATYTVWEELAPDLSWALENPLPDPVIPQSTSGPNSPTPLPAKLGLKPGQTLLAIGAPPTFAKALTPLPIGVNVRDTVTGDSPRDVQGGGGVDLVVWFVDSEAGLRAGLPDAIARSGGSGLWIAWPKQSSPLAGDLNENTLRDAVLELGLVDHKVCAIDADWSALRFAKRKT